MLPIFTITVPMIISQVVCSKFQKHLLKAYEAFEEQQANSTWDTTEEI